MISSQHQRTPIIAKFIPRSAMTKTVPTRVSVLPQLHQMRTQRAEMGDFAPHKHCGSFPTPSQLILTRIRLRVLSCPLTYQAIEDTI